MVSLDKHWVLHLCPHIFAVFYPIPRRIGGWLTLVMTLQKSVCPNYRTLSPSTAVTQLWIVQRHVPRYAIFPLNCIATLYWWIRLCYWKLKGQITPPPPKSVIYSPSSFQNCMTCFLLWNIKEDISNDIGNQTVSVPVDFCCMDKTYNWSQNGFVFIFGWTVPLNKCLHAIAYV